MKKRKKHCELVVNELKRTAPLYVIGIIFEIITLYISLLIAQISGKVLDMILQTDINKDQIMQEIYILLFWSAIIIIPNFIKRIFYYGVGRTSDKILRREIYKKLQYVKEITDHASIFFGDTVELETEECGEFLKLEHIPTLVDALIEKLSNMEVLDEASAKAMLKEIQKEHGIKGKNLFMGSRISLTGQMHGPDLNKIMEVIGKEESISRIKKGIELLSK